MVPSSMLTFISLTHAPSTPLSVLVARATASLMASSKLVSDVALNSVTRAMLMVCASLNPSLLPFYSIYSLAGQKSNMRVMRNPVDHFWLEARSAAAVDSRFCGNAPHVEARGFALAQVV